MAQDQKSFGEIVKNFASSVRQGEKTAGDLKEGLTTSSSTEQLVNQLAAKVNEQLWQARVANWSIWSNEELSLRIPPAWHLREAAGRYLISSFIESASPPPESGIRISISLPANPDNLTAEAWLLSNWPADVDPEVKSVTEIIDGQSALKQDLKSSSRFSANRTQLMVMPVDQKMAEVIVEFIDELPTAEQNVADFLKTISFN